MKNIKNIICVLPILLFCSNAFSQNFKSCELNYDHDVFKYLGNYLNDVDNSSNKIKIGEIVKFDPLRLSYIKIQDPISVYIQTYAEELSKKFQKIALEHSISTIPIKIKDKIYLNKNTSLYNLNKINIDNLNLYQILDISFKLTEPSILEFPEFGFKEMATRNALNLYGFPASVFPGKIINEKLKPISFLSPSKEFKIVEIGYDRFILRDLENNALLLLIGNFIIEKSLYDNRIVRDTKIPRLINFFKNKKLVIHNINEYDFIIIDTLKVHNIETSYDNFLLAGFRGFNQNEEKVDSIILRESDNIYLYECYIDTLIVYNKKIKDSLKLNYMKLILLERLEQNKFKSELLKEGFSEKEITAILNKNPYVGMSENGVKKAFGYPLKTYELAWQGTRVTSLYYGYNFQVYLNNNRVVGWYQEK